MGFDDSESGPDHHCPDMGSRTKEGKPSKCRKVICEGKLNGMCVLSCYRDRVDKLMVLFVEELVERKESVLAVKHSMKDMEAEVFYHDADHNVPEKLDA